MMAVFAYNEVAFCPDLISQLNVESALLYMPVKGSMME
jgi:hypothetical protein